MKLCLFFVVLNLQLIGCQISLSCSNTFSSDLVNSVLFIVKIIHRSE